MIKKIISFLMAAAIAAALGAAPLTAKAQVSGEEGVIALVKELEIMQGDESGDMMLDKKVSRAEFTKIAIALSEQKNTVALGLKQSPYKDVPYTAWYAPYVKAAVSAGYVVGYLDATFRPENTVTYEEAAAILLRVLGYDDSTFGDAYPYGQISKANGLSLFDGVDASVGDELTRRQVMTMVYNALDAARAAGGKLLDVHEVTKTEDVDIISTSNEDDSLGADKVFTSSGTFNKNAGFKDEIAGMTGTVYLKNGKDIVSFIPDEEYENESEGYESYFVYSILSNSTIVGYKDGKFEEIELPDSTSVYNNQQKTTYALMKNTLEMGDTLYIKRTKNGSIDYITYDTNNLTGPVTVTGEDWMAKAGASKTSKVFRSGVESSASAVSVNDIVYYSAPLDVVFAYTDKLTGIYEKASPTKDSPTSVTVSGKDYEIESVEAFNDLSSSGSYKYGDTITLLLGRNGEVAGIAPINRISAESEGIVRPTGGYVLEAGKKDFTNPDGTAYSSFYAKIAGADGEVTEYQTSDDAKKLVCAVVDIQFDDGKVKLSRAHSDFPSGRVSVSKGMIGSKYYAEDVKILDTTGVYTTDTPLYTRIYPQRIDGITLSDSNVLYYSVNDDGDIDRLILKDVTGDNYTYGVIISRDKTTAVCKVDINGTQSEYASAIKGNNVGPHKMKIFSGRIEYLQSIASFTQPVTRLTKTEALIGNRTYLLSDNVVVYIKAQYSSTYLKIPLEQAIEGDYKLTAYYDKQQTLGGRIRIIMAQEK